MSEIKNIGNKIAGMRELRNISRSELAQRSAMSEEVIRDIEEGNDPPAMSALIKIARSLGVRLGTFLDDMDIDDPVITRSGGPKEGMNVTGKSGDANMHLEFFSLARGKSGRHMEPFIIDIDPAAGRSFTFSSHEGEEFIYVIAGEVEILYGKEKYLLRQGDSIYYDSVIDHHVHSAGDAAAKILAVLYVPF